MAKIVPLISTKGSVGKTALVIHIAGYLASLDKHVLLIDADSQQSLSMFFRHEGLDSDISQNGFGKWLIWQMPDRRVIASSAARTENSTRSSSCHITSSPSTSLPEKTMKSEKSSKKQ